MSETHEERFAREDEEWTGPRFFRWLAGTLIVALTVIYSMSSAPGSQALEGSPANWDWDPWGADPADPKNNPLKPGSVSGLIVR